MKKKKKIVVLATLISLIISLVNPNAAYSYDNPQFLPDHPTPVIDLAKAFNEQQLNTLEKSLQDYEVSTGWRIRVLTQYEKTPGKAIKEFWDIDERTLLLVADPRGGNLLNFNVGDAYYALMPRLFWVELQTRYGNQFYVKDNGEDGAILNSIKSVKSCLDKGGCEFVPGLPKEQWIFTLAASIFGGLIAGFASSAKKDNEIISWKWLLLLSPLWVMLFGIFGLAPVITRTSESLPLLRNIMAFIGSVVASFLFAQSSTIHKEESKT